MLGAIAGDIVGSRFEHNPYKSVDFELFTPECRFTDDTVLTCAVADALLHARPYGDAIRTWFRRYPDAGYGARFIGWGLSEDAGPYQSFGNGSAMRVSPVGWLFGDMQKVLCESRLSAAATHDHPEGIRGAQAVAAAIFLARQGEKKSTIREFISKTFKYDLSFSLGQIRLDYGFDVTCQGSVPEAILCFLEADDFESSIRNAVSLGGDADTQAAIAGSIAEAFYGGMPEEIKNEVLSRLPANMLTVLDKFQGRVNLQGL